MPTNSVALLTFMVAVIFSKQMYKSKNFTRIKLFFYPQPKILINWYVREFKSSIALTNLMMC